MPDTSPLDRFTAFKNIVEAIATDWINLRIKEELLREESILCIEPTEADYSKLVGGEGMNVKAMNRLYDLACQADGLTGEVKVSPPPTAVRAPKIPFKFNPKWGHSHIKAVLNPLCGIIFDSGTVTVTDLNKETMRIDIGLTAYAGSLPIRTVEQDLNRVFRSLAKNNGRDVKIQINLTPLPDTSGK